MLVKESETWELRCPFSIDNGKIEPCAGSGCMAWREVKPEVEIRVAGDGAPKGDWRDVTAERPDLIEAWLDSRFGYRQEPRSEDYGLSRRITRREEVGQTLRVYERVLNPGGGYCARLGKPEIPSLKPEGRPHEPR